MDILNSPLCDPLCRSLGFSNPGFILFGIIDGARTAIVKGATGEHLEVRRYPDGRLKVIEFDDVDSQAWTTTEVVPNGLVIIENSRPGLPFALVHGAQGKQRAGRAVEAHRIADKVFESIKRHRPGFFEHLPTEAARRHNCDVVFEGASTRNIFGLLRKAGIACGEEGMVTVADRVCDRAAYDQPSMKAERLGLFGSARIDLMDDFPVAGKNAVSGHYAAEQVPTEDYTNIQIKDPRREPEHYFMIINLAHGGNSMIYVAKPNRIPDVERFDAAPSFAGTRNSAGPRRPDRDSAYRGTVRGILAEVQRLMRPGFG